MRFGLEVSDGKFYEKNSNKNVCWGIVTKESELKRPNFEQNEEIKAVALKENTEEIVRFMINLSCETESVRVLQLIKEGVEHGFSLETIKRYSDLEFDCRQGEEFHFGILKEVDVSIYAKIEFDWRQMKQIRLGLEKKVDVNIYAKSEFDWRQMYQIRLGLEKEVDVSIYAKSEFDWRQMYQIRLGLEKEVDVSIYAKIEFDWQQMYQIHLGLEKEVDVSIYAKSEFNCFQMEEIRLGLEYGLKVKEVSIYAKLEFDYLQMKEIRLGLEAGVDVTIYAVSGYKYYQMRTIFIGLLNGVDMRDYIEANPVYSLLQSEREIKKRVCQLKAYMYSDKLGLSIWQRAEIYKGLMSGIDIEVYAKPDISDGNMCGIRQLMEDEKLHSFTEETWSW